MVACKKVTGTLPNLRLFVPQVLCDQLRQQRINGNRNGLCVVLKQVMAIAGAALAAQGAELLMLVQRTPIGPLFFPLPSLDLKGRGVIACVGWGVQGVIA